MSLPRRRLVRPPAPAASSRPHADARAQNLRARLETERTALARWMSRLKRAFHTVEKVQQRITRLERQLTPAED
jgi:hypothetical protein